VVAIIGAAVAIAVAPTEVRFSVFVDNPSFIFGTVPSPNFLPLFLVM